VEEQIECLSALTQTAAAWLIGRSDSMLRKAEVESDTPPPRNVDFTYNARELLAWFVARLHKPRNVGDVTGVELARLFRVSEETVRRWKLPRTDMGGYDLEDAIAQRVNEARKQERRLAERRESELRCDVTGVELARLLRVTEETVRRWKLPRTVKRRYELADVIAARSAELAKREVKRAAKIESKLRADIERLKARGRESAVRE
jgi:DNA-binding transcriptional regulator YiaG